MAEAHEPKGIELGRFRNYNRNANQGKDEIRRQRRNGLLQAHDKPQASGEAGERPENWRNDAIEEKIKDDDRVGRDNEEAAQAGLPF